MIVRADAEGARGARGPGRPLGVAPQSSSKSAGGSAFFDLVTERFARAGLEAPTEVVLRSGCYFTHDSHHYEEHLARIQHRSPRAAALGEGLRPALEVWARIQSIPEPGLAIATFGKRDASYDMDLPRPLWLFRPGEHTAPQPAHGYGVRRLNDQHAHVNLPEGHALRVGDLMGAKYVWGGDPAIGLTYDAWCYDVPAVAVEF